MTCNSQYINPLNLVGDVGDQEGSGGPTVGMGTTGGRKKRETVKRTLKKRQEAPTDQELSQNVTLVRCAAILYICIPHCIVGKVLPCLQALSPVFLVLHAH